MILESLFIVMFTISVIGNGFLYWYNKKLLQNLLYLSENLGDVYDKFLDFSVHLKSVSELQLFYGDETIMSLMRHAKQLSNEIEEYEYILLLTELEEEQDVTNEEETEEEDE